MRDPGAELHGHVKKARFFLDRLRALAETVGDRRLRVLDLGCGNGTLVTAELAAAGYDVLGVDVHEESIEWARRHVAGASFEVADLESYTPPHEVDAVVLSDILEHVRDPGRLLRTAAAAAPAGVILVSIPNGRGPFELETAFARTPVGAALERSLRATFASLARARRRLLRLDPPPESAGAAYNVESGHVQHFSLPEFERLAAGAGVEVVTRRNGAFIGGPLTYFLFYAAPGLLPLNLRLADRLPPRLVSTWYFELRRRSP